MPVQHHGRTAAQCENTKVTCGFSHFTYALPQRHENDVRATTARMSSATTRQQHHNARSHSPQPRTSSRISPLPYNSSRHPSSTRHRRRRHRHTTFCQHDQSSICNKRHRQCYRQLACTFSCRISHSCQPHQGSHSLNRRGAKLTPSQLNLGSRSRPSRGQNKQNSTQSRQVDGHCALRALALGGVPSMVSVHVRGDGVHPGEEGKGVFRGDLMGVILGNGVM